MISIDWATQIIFVPKTYTQFVSASPFEIRQLDIDLFRLDLKAIEASIPGMPNLRTHTHNTTINVGGVTLARVVTIINGYTITFENGSYAVNLVGANSNIADVTNLNQVQIRSANSAGLTFSDQINSQSFTNNLVYLHVDDGLSGSTFPRGTPTDPVNNWSDAYIISQVRKLHGFDIQDDLIFNSNDPIEGQYFVATTPINASMVLDGRSTNGTTFDRLTVSGLVNGRCSFKSCNLGTLGIEVIDGVQGLLSNCGFSQNIGLDSGATEVIIFNDCISVIAGNTKPIVNCNGTAAPINFRSYTGGLQIDGFTHTGGTMSIDMLAGSVKISSGCTEGQIIVRGVAYLIDESGPNCEVIFKGLLDSESINCSGSTFSGNTNQIAEAVWNKLSVDHQNGGSFGKLLSDLLQKADLAQHVLNVNTDLLNNKPNNP